MKRKTEVKRIFAAFMAMTFLLLVCEPNSIHAKTIRLSPDGDWFSVLSGPSLNGGDEIVLAQGVYTDCLLYTSPSPRDLSTSRMPSSA